MAHLIDKSALVAEIDRLREEKGAFYASDVLYNLEDFINTLEVKEVNLEKEFTNYAENILACDIQFEPYAHLRKCAKHFFELGLLSQLSWKDIERIAEIGMNFMSSEDSDNLNDEEYYTEILNRFKAQKRNY